MAASYKQSTSSMRRFWEDGRGPRSGDEFSVLGAMTTAIAARNAVEDLHAKGVFSDKQAPALNRCLRNRAYEVMRATQLLADIGYDDRLVDFLAERAALDGETGETIEPIAAMRGAIRDAVRDFAKAEHLSADAAAELEAAAVDGATEAFKALRNLDKPEPAKEVSYLARLIPAYWELPAVAPERRKLLREAATDG